MEKKPGMKKRICFIATGGTIACLDSGNGLMPSLGAEGLAAAVPEAGELLKLPSHEKICGNPMRRNGIKGTASDPRSRNHRLYCIRLDRLFLNIRLAIKRIPMIPLINTLHIKKRIIKLATLISSF